MAKINFNSDFTEFLKKLDPPLTVVARNNGLRHFTNGYYNNTNDSYFRGFAINGKSFPVVFTLVFNFPWTFHEWSGRSYKAIDYSSSTGGGYLKFDGLLHFELKIDTDLFKNLGFNDEFKAEPNEFLNIESEKFTIDKTNLTKNIKSFTLADIKNIEKWFDKAIKNMLEKVEQPISLQASRRFDELMAYDETIAMKYCPQNVKDIFIF